MGVFAVIVALLAVMCGLFGTLFFGTTGLIITGVLAGLAILLGILKRNKTQKGGIAGIVIAALALIMAFSMNNVWSSMFKDMHSKALQYKPDGLWAKVSEKTDGGIFGLISNMPSDEATMNALVEEMNELNKLTTDAQ